MNYFISVTYVLEIYCQGSFKLDSFQEKVFQENTTAPNMFLYLTVR